MAKEKQTQINFWYVVVAVGLMMLFQTWFAARNAVEDLPYSEFMEALRADRIAEITVRESTIQGRFREIRNGRQYFVTARVDPQLAPELDQYDVVVRGGTENTFLRDLLSWVVPAAVFALIWIFIIRRFAERQGFGGLMNVGKSKARVYVEKDTKVTFDDVAGVDEAKAELAEIVAFLKTPEKYGRLGARIPKGILLVGPPGTGKTLLARAVAGEAGVSFFSISGSEFVEMFVGVGAARVRDLFEQARAAKPCIIFVDELDALGRRRGAGASMGGHDEKEQTLNQLLAELDGFDPREGIVLLAATNRPEILDPALLRAGRFDRQVLVDRPDRLGRRQILDVHVKKVTLAPDADLDAVAGLTPGFTGADLANLVNEATLVATRRDGDAVTLDDFTNAIERIVAGLEKTSRLLNEHEREVVAHHEMGHALVAATLPDMDPVHKVSIIPRGIGALGYTLQRPTEDRFLITTEELKNRMAVLMGGRAAEKLIFSEVSTGAADDLEKATEIARTMAMRYGMGEGLGQAVYQPQRNAFLGDEFGAFEQRSYAEETAREIDLTVRSLTDDAFTVATEVLKTRRGDLEKGAKLLLEKETLTVNDFPPIAAKTGVARNAGEVLSPDRNESDKANASSGLRRPL